MRLLPWPFRRPAARTRLPEAWEDAAAEPETHPSPGFEELSSWLDTVAAPRILDLGEAVGVNLDHFAAREARLQVSGLLSALRGHPRGSSPAEENPERVFDELLPLTAEGSFDVILVWDLFNYLSRLEMRALGARLARLSHPGTRALAMISNRALVPAQPVPVKIVDHATLRYPMTAAESRSNPRWPPGEVQMAMKGFAVDRSFLLRHGIQEFLFVREDQA